VARPPLRWDMGSIVIGRDTRWMFRSSDLRMVSPESDWSRPSLEKQWARPFIPNSPTGSSFSPHLTRGIPRDRSERGR